MKREDGPGHCAGSTYEDRPARLPIVEPFALGSALSPTFGPLGPEETRLVEYYLGQSSGRVLDAFSALDARPSFGLTPSGLVRRQQDATVTVGAGVSLSAGQDLVVEFLAYVGPASQGGDLIRRWSVESEIYADCDHRTYHRQQHLVWNSELEVDDPVEAAQQFAGSIERLIRLATDHSPRHWVDRAEDW